MFVQQKFTQTTFGTYHNAGYSASSASSASELVPLVLCIYSIINILEIIVLFIEREAVLTQCQEEKVRM